MKTYYVLQNLFTENDIKLIDLAIKGMMLANSLERHADQRKTYGQFSEALKWIVNIVYDEYPEAGDKIMNGWQFEGCDGEDFINYVDSLIREDTSTVADLLTGVCVEV